MSLPAIYSIKDLKRLKGVGFPSLYRFRQLLITGMPGCGKSTLIRSIGEWSDIRKSLGSPLSLAKARGAG